MELVLVSACLLGEKVRYDGDDKLCLNHTLLQWREEGRIVPLCPEIAGGFPVPRPPAEITDSRGGAAVLMNKARVVEITGRDVTVGFLAGAAAALAQVKRYGIRIAVLKEGSPSCGSAYTYDGTFSGGTASEPGVTTALLREHGVQVFSELELRQAEAQIKLMEAGAV